MVDSYSFRNVSGYPLPTLLRLALLALHTAPYSPLDVLLSYSHLNLQNSTLLAFASAFHTRAHVTQLITASPLNMGLLAPSIPSFHPASPALRQATADAQTALLAQDSTLVDAALGYAYREARAADLPTVVGFSRPSEVHETIRVWRDLQAENTGTNEDAAAERRAREAGVLRIFAPFVDYSWTSP